MGELVALLTSEPVGLVFVMHTQVPDVAETLALVREYWDGPVGAYPESGYFIEPHWQFVDIIQPKDLVEAAQEWVAQGAQVLGGCCGLGVSHIEALKTGFAPAAGGRLSHRGEHH
jgi:homocysteine S-methyltransferase